MVLETTITVKQPANLTPGHSNNDYIFSDLSDSAELFFAMLPADWQAGIVPFWQDYQSSARVYTLRKDHRLAGGGLVFSKPSPDTLTYKNEAQNWFDKGYLYIGFLWIDQQFRNRQLGSYWLQQVFRQNPGQKFWLAIEDESLASFYSKNGFYLKKTIHLADSCEWIMLRD